MGHARRDQQPIQRGATGGKQRLAHVGVEAAVIGFVGRQPVGQRGFEALAAGLEGGQPNDLERGQQFIRIVVLGPTAHEGCGERPPGAQGADGRLAVITEKLDQFGDDFGLVESASSGIALALLGQHFLTCLFTHVGVHIWVTPLLSLQWPVQPAHTPPSVTFFLSQIGFENYATDGADLLALLSEPGIVNAA